MSRYYEISVEIEQCNPRRLKRVEEACVAEWGFEADDFRRSRTGPKGRWTKVTATAQGSICAGESEEEFSLRLAQAIWKANRGYCYVKVFATYLENLPCETYTFARKDYKRMRDRRGNNQEK